jgi:hypothetical protein
MLCNDLSVHEAERSGKQGRERAPSNEAKKKTSDQKPRERKNKCPVKRIISQETVRERGCRVSFHDTVYFQKPATRIPTRTLTLFFYFSFCLELVSWRWCLCGSYRCNLSRLLSSSRRLRRCRSTPTSTGTRTTRSSSRLVRSG